MIELQEVTPDNHVKVRALAVLPEQQQFVAGVEQTLADAFVWKDASVRVACISGEPIGLVCIFPFTDHDIPVVNIVRLLIDAKFQGRGYGRALLESTLDWITGLGAERIRISTHPDNTVALSLYRSAGFAGSNLEDGEIALYLGLGGRASPGQAPKAEGEEHEQ